MKVKTESKFGLIRAREYGSPREVAEGIVSCFEYCDERVLDLIADVRVSGKSASIVITTKEHMVRFLAVECGELRVCLLCCWRAGLAHQPRSLSLQRVRQVL